MRILNLQGMVDSVLKPSHIKRLPDSRTDFRARLVEWFELEGRDYPWRRTRDPYEVLVSEVMLQQTQVSTVLGKGYFQNFLEVFPDLESLACASDDELLKAWEGLGYYRRARMLRDTASAVIERYDRRFPAELDALLDLPGIGRYTAGALRAFAFGEPSVLVDGNVARVLARLMDYADEVDSTAGQKQIWQWAAVLADDTRPRSYHSALMELGQRICRPGNPDCTNCPVAGFCATREPELLPRKKARVKITPVDEHAVWVRNRDGQILMHHEQGARRTGLWKLPLREPMALGESEILAESNYAITRYKVTLRVHAIKPDISAARPQKGDQWVDENRIAELPMAAPFRKVVERLLDE